VASTPNSMIFSVFEKGEAVHFKLV